MNKKILSLMSAVLVAVLCVQIAVYANMAMPRTADVGTSVTFEKNESISVISEVLDITVRGAMAEITATYTMKNTTGEAVSTPSMFIAPSIEYSEVSVTENGEELKFTAKDQAVAGRYDLECFENDGWQYKVFYEDVPDEDMKYYDRVATVRFDISFMPYEEKEIAVSYLYCLGGYPTYDWQAKYGVIEYYLTPANLWKDFSDLTVNLTLDSDMPVITDSTLKFDSLGNNRYVYHSDSMPEVDLKVEIDQTAFQSFISSFKNPYLLWNLLMILPLVLPIVIIAIIILAVMIHKRRKKQQE